MGFFERLGLGRKEDPISNPVVDKSFDLGREMSTESLGDETLDPFGKPVEPEQKFDPGRSFEVKKIQEPSPQASAFDQSLLNKNMEIVSAKIDGLKAELENMNQRLVNIESIARAEQKKQVSPKRYGSW